PPTHGSPAARRTTGPSNARPPKPNSRTAPISPNGPRPRIIPTPLTMTQGWGILAITTGEISRSLTGSPLSLIEFPADDPERARRFCSTLLDVELEVRQAG